MNKVRLFFSLTLLLFAGATAKAQYYFYNDKYYNSDVVFEVGASLNAMNCLTDLGGKKGVGKKFLKDFNFGQTQASGGLFISALYRDAIALRLEGTYGRLSGQDEVLRSVTDIAKQRYNRNLNFRTFIFEGSLLAEIHPLFIVNNYYGRDEEPPRYSPYLVGGVGYFSFSPEGTLPGTDSYVSLQPLHTEGQGFPTYPDRSNYKLQQINIPVGAGIKYELSSQFNVRLESIYRILNTDYLDDLSTRYIDPEEFDKYLSPARAAQAKLLSDKQISPVATPSTGRRRGNPDQNDGYFSVNLKIGIVLGRDRR